MNIRLLLITTLLFLLAGCQTAPKRLQGEFASLTPVDAPRLATGDRVRWAGIIHQVRNERLQTCLIVIGLPQKSSGRPHPDGEPQGRFEACIARFLDPAIYAKGRAITVTGRLKHIREQQVGDYPLQVAVIDMDQHVLWRPVPRNDNETILLFDPWWPDLWFHGHGIHHPHRIRHKTPASNQEPH